MGSASGKRAATAAFQRSVILLLISLPTLTQTDLKTGTICKLRRHETAQNRKSKRPLPRLPKRLRRAAYGARSDMIFEALREASPPPVTYPFSTDERKVLLFRAQQEDLEDKAACLEAAWDHLVELLKDADEESQRRANARTRTNLQPPQVSGGWMLTHPWSKDETKRLLAYNYHRDLMQVAAMLANVEAAIGTLTP